MPSGKWAAEGRGGDGRGAFRRPAEKGENMDRFFEWFGLPGEMVLAAVLFLLAAVLALVFPNRARILAAAGMLCCALGDALAINFLDVGRFLPFPPLLAGLAFFSLGRAGYTAAYASLIRRNRDPLYTPPFGAAVVITLAFLAAAMVAMVTGGTYPGGAAVALCVLYALSSGSMLAVVWSCSRSERSVRSAAAAGALALFAVDVVYGLGVLCQMHQLDGLIWWVYPFAQLLLLLCA